MNLLKRLHALGVPPSVSSETVREVNRWVAKSGSEWTVNRLKLLKQELISRISDGDFVAPWVTRNNSGLPKGPFSWYFRLALSGDERKISLAINSLMLYSSFVSTSITSSQERKFFSSMESTDETGISARPRIIPFLKKDLVKKNYSSIPNVIEVALSNDKFQMGCDGKSYSESNLGVQYQFAMESVSCRYLIGKFPRLFKSVLPGSIFLDSDRKLKPSDINHEMILSSIGKISFIQEPGFKLRAVANPSRVIQCALEPLKDFARDLLKSCSNDCTFDQSSGITTIQKWLNEGKRCHSVDLSDATNLFPRNYQIHLLRSMVDKLSNDPSKRVLHDTLDLFDLCCQFPWVRKNSDGSVSLHKFTRGQPLGLGPSFFIFGYTHNILLEGLCLKHNIPKDFVVLGDDVCISNDRLAELYRASLNNLGCKVSEAKSIVSTKFAEFAGCVITPKSVIHQFKWRDLDDNNFVDVCRQIGPKSVILLSYQQRAVIEAIAEIPSELGGLGWNPSGKSLSERLSTPIAQMLIESKDKPLIPYESVVSRAVRFWYDPIVRTYYPSRESREIKKGPRSRTEVDQTSLIELFFFNPKLTDGFTLAFKKMKKGVPYPTFILSSEIVGKDYICTVPILGIFSKDKLTCTKFVLQHKISKSRISNDS